MDIIYELLDGTIPSRPLTLTIDMERFGVVFTVHALRFQEHKRGVPSLNNAIQVERYWSGR